MASITGTVTQVFNSNDTGCTIVHDPVANMDLWRRVLDAAKAHQIEWRWVRGHSGDIMNDRVDRLATSARGG